MRYSDYVNYRELSDEFMSEVLNLDNREEEGWLEQILEQENQIDEEPYRLKANY